MWSDDRAVLIDLAAILAVSVAICTLDGALGAMTAVVLAAIAGRSVATILRPGASAAREIALFGALTVLGAFNDWRSVSVHRIYDYTVPSDLGELSLIPLWMLLYWGLILRFVLTLSWWDRLALPAPRDTVLGARRPALRVAILLGLVLLTRQSIYRFYLHPIASWLPFALALLVLLLALGVDRRRQILLGAVIAVGPLVEVLYIQVGGLHAYHLGWLAGVPLWIALWWGLGALVLGELATRAFARVSPLGA